MYFNGFVLLMSGLVGGSQLSLHREALDLELHQLSSALGSLEGLQSTLRDFESQPNKMRTLSRSIQANPAWVHAQLARTDWPHDGVKDAFQLLVEVIQQATGTLFQGPCEPPLSYYLSLPQPLPREAVAYVIQLFDPSKSTPKTLEAIGRLDHEYRKVLFHPVTSIWKRQCQENKLDCIESTCFESSLIRITSALALMQEETVLDLIGWPHVFDSVGESTSEVFNRQLEAIKNYYTTNGFDGLYEALRKVESAPKSMEPVGRFLSIIRYFVDPAECKAFQADMLAAESADDYHGWLEEKRFGVANFPLLAICALGRQEVRLRRAEMFEKRPGLITIALAYMDTQGGVSFYAMERWATLDTVVTSDDDEWLVSTVVKFWPMFGSRQPNDYTDFAKLYMEEIKEEIVTDLEKMWHDDSVNPAYLDCIENNWCDYLGQWVQLNPFTLILILNHVDCEVMFRDKFAAETFQADLNKCTFLKSQSTATLIAALKPLLSIRTLQAMADLVDRLARSLGYTR